MLILQKENISLLPKGFKLPLYAIIWAVFFLSSVEGFSKDKITAVATPAPPPINFAGEIAGNEVQNTGYNPSLITSVSAATTTSGSIVYKWQYSIDGINWTDIGSSNSQTYDPPAITATRYYRRLTESQSTNFEATSNVISKIVTNYTITTPVLITAGNTLNLTQTGVFPNLMLDELVNGSFTNGNSGFSSDVPLGTGSGNYGVNERPRDIFGGSYENFRDRFGRGKLFAVRSPGVVGQRMWYITINVVAGNTYDLSAWIRGFNDAGNPSQLRWYVDNSPLGTTLTAPAGSWSELATSFTASVSGSVVISVKNLKAGSTGNSFAMDDMTIYEHTPVTYLWTGPNGFTSTSPNPTIPNAQAVNSGTYTLTVTKNGYSVSVSKVITVDAAVVVCLPPTVTLTRTNVTCNGENDGVITATGTDGNGGLGNLTYQYWDNISGTSVTDLTSNSNYPNSPSGTFLISKAEAPTNFLDNYGARMSGYIVPRTTGTYYFWIASDDNSQLWISTDQTPANKVLRASITGSTNPQEWNKAGQTNQKSVAITLTAGQKYYIEILHKEGTGGDNLAVGWARPGDPTTTPFEVLPPSVLRPNVASSLTTPIYQYKLDAGAFQSSPVFNGVTPGTHTVTLQDSYGCTATASITVTEPAAFSSGITAPSSVCAGTTINLSATAVSSGDYDWVGPNGFNDDDRTPSIDNATFANEGVYTLTVDVNGCTRTYTAFVSVVENPIISRTFVSPTCGFNNGSITFNITDDPNQSQVMLSINGGSTFTTVNDNIGTYTFSGLSAGSYSLRAKWATGNVCQVTIPSANLVSSTNLLGLSLTQSTIKICANIPVSDSVKTNLLAGVSPYTYAWSNGGGTQFSAAYSPTVNTTYTVTVTDNMGCTATASVLYQVVSSPTPSITSVDSLICVNGSSTITSSIDVKGTYTYQWYQSADGITWSLISGSTNSTFTNSFLVAGNYFYRVIVDGAGGACAPGTSNTFKITVVPSPTASVVSPSSNTCLGTQASLSANVSNGAGSITYQWQQSPNGTSGWADIVGATSVTYNPANSVAGVFYYRVIATMSAVGCSYAVSPSYTFTVVNPGTVSVSPSTTELCLDGSQTLSTTITGASGLYTYQWQEGSSTSTWWNLSGATSANYAPTNDSLGLRYYRPVINFSVCGLYYPSPAQIETNDIPVVTATITNQTVCIGGSTQLQGTITNMTGTPTYQWESRTSLFGTWTAVSGATSINYTPPTATSGTVYYRLRLNSSAINCGPQYSSSVTLDIVPQTTVTISPSSTTICLNGVYNLTSSIQYGVGPFTYQWQSATSSGGPFANISGATNSTYSFPTNALGTIYYRLIVNASGSGCNPATSNFQTITVLPLPTVSATNTSNTNSSVSQCVGTLVLLKSTVTGLPAASTYAWSSGSGFSSTNQNTTALLSTGASGGAYTVTVLATNGCSNTATTNVVINTNCSGSCQSIIDIRPLNPTGCATTDGNITADEFGGNNYETSIDGITWTRGYKVYSGLGVGSYLVFLRDWTSKIICRTVNITLESKTTAFYTGETVTNATGCFNADGRIVLSGVLSTDQVSWISLANKIYTPVSSLSPANTITGLKPGTYFVRVIRGGILLLFRKNGNNWKQWNTMRCNINLCSQSFNSKFISKW